MLSWGALSKAMWVRRRGDRAVPNRRKLHPGEIVLLLLLREKLQNRKVSNYKLFVNAERAVSSCPSRIPNLIKSFSLTGAGYAPWIRKLPLPQTNGKEHPEEWKELEHMLYYSEANFHKRVAPDTLEDVDIKQPRSYNPEAFLPEEVRNAIYNDRRWFDRSKYLPEGSDEDPFMYLDTQIYDALHALTELQREILFRTVINGESTESVAQDKQCSSRNIRDIRARALRQIRAKIKRREGYGRPDVVIIILLFMLLVGVPLACWGEQLWAAYPWLESVAAVLSALVMAVMFQNSLRREAERLLHQHWASLNGSQKKE